MQTAHNRCVLYHFEEIYSCDYNIYNAKKLLNNMIYKLDKSIFLIYHVNCLKKHEVNKF